MGPYSVRYLVLTSIRFSLLIASFFSYLSKEEKRERRMSEDTKSQRGSSIDPLECSSVPPSSVEEIENEIALACGIYEDAITRDPSDPFTLTFQLPFELVVSISFPRRGYPGKQGLHFTVINGPNAVLTSRFQQWITKSLQDDLAQQEEEGNVLLFALPLMMSSAVEFEQQVKEERSEALQKKADEKQRHAKMVESVLEEEAQMPFFQSQPIVDRKSKFIAHLAPVQSLEDVRKAVQYLRHQKEISIAHHPAIWAYRFRDPTTERLCADMDDDGETGASSRIMFLMEQLQVEGWVVVVTRWFGGILLGPDRFKHIMAVARDVITSCPAIRKPV